jgi:hypothetical protein
MKKGILKNPSAEISAQEKENKDAVEAARA